MTSQSSFAPDVIAGIEDLEVAARVVVEGLRAGAHRSPMRGAGTEFVQHRAYRAGDDLRHLDWKLFARSERLFTREFRETTDLSLQLVVDPSASMEFPADGVSKRRCAQVLAASLAYLVVAQGGAVGVTYANEDGLQFLRPRAGVAQRSAVIARLDGMHTTNGPSTPGGVAWRPLEALRMTGEWVRRRSVVVVLSDFYDEEDATIRELAALARRGHDVRMLQTLSAAELSLDMPSLAELEDLETGERRAIDSATARAAYRARLDAFLGACRTRAADGGVEYHLVRTDDSPVAILRALLQRPGS